MPTQDRFLLSNYISTSGTGGHWWRGYHFRVSEPIEVNRLYGGGTGGFMVGLFTVNSNVVPQQLLRSGTLSSGRLRELEVSPIELVPGQDYLIAQQRVSSGSHYTVNSFSSQSVESHGKINYFRPDGQCYRWHNSGTSSTYIIGRNYGSTNSTRPDVGFGYSVISGNFTGVNIDGNWQNINNMFVYAEATVFDDTQFNLSDYASLGGTRQLFWRGYAFEPNTDMTVTGIICGATGSNFSAGLYSASEITPTSLLASVEAPSTRAGLVSISPVSLDAGQRYILAQGRVSGTNNHYHVDTIDTNAIENSDLFSTWLPSSGDCYRWASTGNDTYIVGRDYDNISSINPHLGLEIEFGTSGIETGWHETDSVFVNVGGNWEPLST